MATNKVELQHFRKCILVAAITPDISEEKVNEYLDELQFLALTANMHTIARFKQKIEKPNPKTFIGEGKLHDIRNFIKEHEINIAIFDDELTGTQLRNINQILNVQILDRTNLILDIFAMRAKTAYAKVQVELAQYEYMLPRLTRMWTHLERQQGGIGMRGPGEKELETDKRIIKKRISTLKEELKKIDTQKQTQRQNRSKLVRVAMVGYTNVGKSTLMNLLSKSNVFAENKLFATLDTTVRRVVIDNVPFLLSDTVGFIRKLPHTLVESFKSTLDEIREAEVVLHVLDISHSSFLDHLSVVNQTLLELNITEQTFIHVCNKIDLLSADEVQTRINDVKTMLENYHMHSDNVIAISATNKRNVEQLRQTIYQVVKKIHAQKYPFDTFLYPDVK
ncbi:MAG: GTPase HflX [Bacteroidales bacterium]|nr:GTPase HflX [Bacteroidales bacterium]